MPVEHPNCPIVDDAYTVHLAQQSDSWSITVTRAGRRAAFEVHHRDAQLALAMAKGLAVTERADLVVVTATPRGYELVPAARVASYVLPTHPQAERIATPGLPSRVR